MLGSCIDKRNCSSRWLLDWPKLLRGNYFHNAYRRFTLEVHQGLGTSWTSRIDLSLCLVYLLRLFYPFLLLPLFFVGSTLFPYHKQHDRFLMRLAISLFSLYALAWAWMAREWVGVLRYGPLGWDIVREVVRLPSHNFVCIVVRRCVYSALFMFRLAS